MRRFQTIFLILLLFHVFSKQVQAQNSDSLQVEQFPIPSWSIKSNLLYDATMTINLGVEFRTGKKSSFDIPVNYNAWTFSRDRKWRHFLVQPEFRWWPKEVFQGHFWGLHGHYALYNVGNFPHPPFAEYMESHRFEGWLAGAGVSYGYRWNFNRRWALEATIGVGYAHLSYDKFNCGRCGELVGSGVKNYVGPTKAGITLIYGIGGKRASKSRPVPVYGTLSPEPVKPPMPYEPEFSVSFITPEVEMVKVRNESGKAFLDFAVGRSEIVSGFRNNTAELQKIQASIELVKNNPDATITSIEITGHASPEGSYTANQLLSERRAQALREYIRSVYNLQEDMFKVQGSGEDWVTLDTLIDHSDLTGKYRIQEIIRKDDNPDAREQKLRAFSGGIAYRRIVANYYPQLRRSDYSVNYTVVPFTVEKGKEVFRTRPDNLSLNEMFLIANTYEPDSDASHEVFETAARIFPDSDVANINTAASALERKDTVLAARYLDKVREQNSVYWNNMGILAWLQGNKQKAAECFAKGGEQGAGNAVELNKHIQSSGLAQ